MDIAFVRHLRTNIDWILVAATLPLLAAGLVTMNTFVGENTFFVRQLMWIGVAFAAFFGVSFVDVRFLKRTDVLVMLYGIALLLLGGLLLFGSATQGARSWFDLGFFSFQPADPIKLLLILILAKYFSRRHIEIAHIKHILVSGLYAFLLFILIFFQPDFGTAIIIFLIWLGMTLVSGISKKHLFLLFLLGAVAVGILWNFAFEPYQKDRILSFLHPYAEVQGAGYNAYQSMVAVGSGGLFGKDVGYGTQSRLKFLPEYQTDFIFAAFAEEWGFVGVFIVFALYGVVIWRILANALVGATNFETLFAVGLATLFMAHILIHVGTNIGLLPVTGTTIPFMSYGGSHLVTEFVGLGILMSMRQYSRTIHRSDSVNELVGV